MPMDVIAHLLSQSRKELLCRKAREVLDFAATSDPNFFKGLVNNKTPMVVQKHRIFIDPGTKQVIVVTPDETLEARFCHQIGCIFTPLKSSNYCKNHHQEQHQSADGEIQSATDDPSEGLQAALDIANKKLDMIRNENTEAKKSIQSITRNQSHSEQRPLPNPIKRPQNNKCGKKCALPKPEHKAEIIYLD